ncbi:MAG: ABC transporter ATP-binding protein [Cyanobacteria bacterium SZAS TMP-1]|nr:ABC transporter ATP-binding protein [Cyanobacteria bacterium SZAS TMP-1]
MPQTDISAETPGNISEPDQALVQLVDVSKTYGEHQVHALSAVSLAVPRGQFLSLMGASGCGKSTLLNLIAGLDHVSSGRIILAGDDITGLSDEEVTTVRGKKIGFIFQFFNLLSTLTVEENVSLPLELTTRLTAAERRTKVSEILTRVGMAERMSFYPAQLSGGEMQRVAIARALVHSPQLIVADEPTGNLDSENGLKILTLLKELNQTLGQTIIMATHSEEAAQFGHRIIQMKDGKIVNERICSSS